MRKYEKIKLYNIDNDERFSTYVIKGKRGSGKISPNGATTCRAHVDNLLIIRTYVPMNEERVANYKPKVVLLGEGNKIKVIKET